MTDIGIIVFVRFDSERLPGKALCPVGGRPVLGRVLDRVRLIRGEHPVVVATTDRSLDDPIASFARDENVRVFRGDADNVAARAMACADAYNFEAFLRICGDSPFLDPFLATRALEEHERGDAQVTTNIFPRTFPPGTSVEVIASDAMRDAVGAMTDDHDREHVTSYFYRHPEAFRICNIAADDDRYSGVHLAVDTSEDLERAEYIANAIRGPIEAASLDEVVALGRAYDRSVRSMAKA